MKETWRDLPRDPRYSVSSRGRVRGVRGQLLKLTPNTRWGYNQVHIGKSTVYVYVLVAETFLDPRPSPDHEVCHGPNGQADNSVENLRWGTRKENVADSVREGTRFPGVQDETHWNARISDAQVAEVRRRYDAGETVSALAREFGMTPQGMRLICKRLTRKDPAP